jgi:REP element-mobilizing transposase RayT
MPRKSRIDAPGAFHHIIARGIERRSIFHDDRDRDGFLERLGSILKETGTSCYAWALMLNHFHLLLRTGTTPISVVMRRLLTGHAVSYNSRHSRQGHLFQNRYKSILCQEDPYLLELVRYIHLNPVRARLVNDLKSLDSYSYCGHSALLGKRKKSWQDTDYILSLFDETRSPARRRYREFCKRGISQGKRSDLVGGGLILKAGGLDFEKIVDRVANLMGMKRDEVLASGKRKKAVEARSIVCFWVMRELGISQTILAERFGISQPAISMAVGRGERLAKHLTSQ